MSYFLTAYLVDLPGIKSAIGSKDLSLIEAVEGMIQERFDDDPDEEIQTQQSAAIRQLVMGEPRDVEDVSHYGWVLVDICRSRGEELLPDYWGGVRWDAVKVCGLEDLLTKVGPPVELPPNKDMPHIGFIKRDEIAKYQQAAEALKAKTKEEGVHDLLDEYLEWLGQAAEENKDVVLVYG